LFPNLHRSGSIKPQGLFSKQIGFPPKGCRPAWPSSPTVTRHLLGQSSRHGLFFHLQGHPYLTISAALSLWPKVLRLSGDGPSSGASPG
jgi:hypothetical protein